MVEEYIACHGCDFHVLLPVGYTLIYQDGVRFEILNPDDSLLFAAGIGADGWTICPCCHSGLYYDDEPEE